jgi:hypothetical protein
MLIIEDAFMNAFIFANRTATLIAIIAFASIAANSLAFATPLEQEGPVRVMTGGTTFTKLYKPKQAEIERVIGAPFEILTAPQDTAVLALSKNAIDGVISGNELNEILEAGEKKGMPKQDPKDYQLFEVYHVDLKIALHPENPTNSLTHEQLVDILSGKIRTWEPINGKKIPIRFLIAKSYLATMQSIYKHYLKGMDSPVAEQVVNSEGMLRGIQRDPGAIAFFSVKEELKDFKPKYIDSDIRHPSYFMSKINPRPATKKLIDYLKAAAKTAK